MRLLASRCRDFELIEICILGNKLLQKQLGFSRLHR